MQFFKTDKYRDVVPAISEADFAVLKQSIAAHGLLQPIEVDGDGNVLDGHSRLRAIEELAAEDIDVGATHRTLHKFDSEAAARSYIRAINLHRRHLTSEQKRELIAAELIENPTSSNRVIAKMLGVDDKTVAKVRTAKEATAEIPQLTKTTGADGRTRTVRSKRSASKRGKRSTGQGVSTLTTTEGTSNLDWLNGPTDAKEEAYQRRTLAFQQELEALLARYSDIVEWRFDQKLGWIINAIPFDQFEPAQAQPNDTTSTKEQQAEPLQWNDNSRSSDQARGVKGEYQINRVIGRTVRTTGRNQVGECFQLHFLEDGVEYGNPEASVIGRGNTMDEAKALAERHHRGRTLH
jgi:ParB-like chromosome segregation protein Spo0J